NDNTIKDVTYTATDFTSNGITANPANGASLTVANHNAKPVTLTCSGETANTSNLKVVAKAVTTIAVKTQPTKLNYVEGQTLDLTGLVLTITYNDNTIKDVTYTATDFTSNGITANPANGASLTVANHNAKPVTLTCSGKTANTSNLTVTVSTPVATTFFSVEGKDIIDPATSEPYMIKSINIENDVWWQSSWRNFRRHNLCSYRYYRK
ncbi:MAG: hypothetical protein FWF46_06105, partial [Oscillospiraceae bacterium]|nr:hypothetical protein [Oscillospiraceae bacterium]